MKVYLLIHDDRWYELGDKYVRAVYATREAAEHARVSRTPSGRRSQSYDAHTERCCDIDEWDVLDSPTLDVVES